MFTDDIQSDVVVTGLGAACPIACDLPALAAAGRNGLDAPHAARDWFDAPRFLGPRGYKYLPAATRYMLAAAGLAFDHAAIADGTYIAEQRGVMVGSNFAVAPVHETMDRTILTDGADALSPMEVANFSINLAASHVSLKYGCKAFNVCFTSGMVAGLEALIFGAGSIRRGRADLVLAGATEGIPPPGVGEVLGGVVPAGGACAIVLERASEALQRGATVYGTFSAGVLGFSDPTPRRDDDAGLAAMVTDAVERMQLAPGAVHLYDLRCGYPNNDAVGRLVRRALESRGIAAIETCAPASDGSLLTVSPMLQVALALYERKDCVILTTSPRGQIAMVAFAAAGEGTAGAPTNRQAQYGKVGRYAA